MSRRDPLMTLETLVDAYVRALGSRAAAWSRRRALRAVRREYALVRFWRGSGIDAATLVAAARASAEPEQAVARVRRISASLWKARGRVKQRMGIHPDVIAPLRTAAGDARRVLLAKGAEGLRHHHTSRAA